MPLPVDPKERKAIPIFSGVLMYFPLALAEVAKVSKLGNDKHNPGQPLNWSRGKSNDHMDSAVRHIMDAGPDGDGEGEDGMHLANAIWRLSAKLQLVMEARAQQDTRPWCDHGNATHARVGNCKCGEQC